MTAPITIFTKQGCPHCAKAKEIFDTEGLHYENHDIEKSKRNVDLAVYLSGASTVPQIFIGDHYVGGADELALLAEAGRIQEIVSHAGLMEHPDSFSDEELAEGAEDFKLREAIPEIDGSKSTKDEDLPILRMYKEFFGFWPNCFYYMYRWPEVAYRQFVYCHNAGAIGGGKHVIGAPVMYAVGFATSEAQGCDYCQVHSASTGGEESAGYTKYIREAREGNFGDDNPFGPFEVALAELAAKASTNHVTPDTLEAVRNASGEARFTKLPPGPNIEATALIAAAFGFLNVFNDLTGVEVEAGWAQNASDNAGIDTGRHGSSEEDRDNLAYDISDGGSSMKAMIAHYAKDVVLAGGPARYAKKHLDLAPGWIESWPLALRPLHARFYVGVMTNEDDHGMGIAPELKHLMARVSAIGKRHDYLAATEGYMAWLAGGESDKALNRVEACYDAARDFSTCSDLFSQREIAALRLAWISARVPLTTPHRWVKAAIGLFSPDELVHLISVCAMASMTQRFVAVEKPEQEAEVTRWIGKHGLTPDTLSLRHPVQMPVSLEEVLP